MKKLFALVIALLIGLAFTTTSFAQDKPAADPAQQTVEKEKPAKQKKAKKAKKAKSSKKAKKAKAAPAPEAPAAEPAK